MPLQLDRILATPVDGDTVGAPATTATTVGAVGDQGWSLRDLSPPVVTLRASAIAHNLALMQRWTAEHGVELYPHGKTTMAPQLWARQLEAGAGGITAATPAQLRAMRSVGVPSVLLANEVVDAGAIAWIGHETSTVLACWVDSVEGVELLADGVAAANRPPLRVLVEVGHREGRTGARSPEAAIAVAETVARRPELALAGVAGYEGTIGHERTPGVLADVDAFLGVLAAVSDRIVAPGSSTARRSSAPAAACSSTGSPRSPDPNDASCSGPAARSPTTTVCTSVDRRSRTVRGRGSGRRSRRGGACCRDPSPRWR